MNDHSHYEELAALAAGGQLNDEELKDLQRHSETCVECRTAAAEFRDIVHFGLPLTQSPFRRSVNMLMSGPDSGARERFIRRASLEGIAFSDEVRTPTDSGSRRLTFGAVGAGVLAAVVAAVFVISHYSGEPSRQLESLSQQNSALETTIAQLERTNAEQRLEAEDLHHQVATLGAAASNGRHGNDKARTDTTRSALPPAQSLEATEIQGTANEKMLANTKAELEGLKRAHADDLASIVADQYRINELSEQLKATKSNVNMEKRLATVSGGVDNLMGARQLHVIDVRDTDSNGKPSKAFGRIFLTEGSSLVFYAFDLNTDGKNDRKMTYQVWAQPEGKAGSLRSLGSLKPDNKMPGRWALKSADPAALKQISSIFVTVEPQRGAKTPNGQRLLFAYLGKANHP